MHATHHSPTVGAPTPDPTPADTLRRTADYLERHGWIQRQYYSSLDAVTPACCIIGALAMVTYGYQHLEPFWDIFEPGEDALIDCWSAFVNAELALSSYLGLLRTDEHHDPDDIETVHDWNDKVATSAAEVIATLRAAADDYERAGA